MPLNPVLSGAAQIATNQVSVVTTTPTAIIGPRSSRRGVIIENVTGTDTVYLGTNAVTTTKGYPLPAVANASVYIPTTTAIYGIVTTSAQTVGVMEIFDQG